VKLGVDAIELDVQLSRDGHVVVIHDERLERTTDGEGWVGEHTLAELRRLDAGGEPLPLLAEVLGVVPESVGLNVEFKNGCYPYPGLVGKTLAILEGRDPQGVLLSCFDHEVLAEAGRSGWEGPLGALVGHLNLDLWDELERLGVVSLHPDLSLCRPALIAEAHRRGLAVYPWTARTPLEHQLLVEAGVDGVITDRPDLYLSARP
jgi:glycerophosphoryl diester phosphodiesterase